MARKKSPKQHKSSRRSPRSPGRPTDFRPQFCELAANLCAQGCTDFEVAQALDVHVSTLYRWKVEHPQFREALCVGKETADDRVEAALYHRAVGYSYRALKIMQNNGAPVLVPYVEHQAPDVGAITLWLTNRRRGKWRSVHAHELSGPNGQPIPVQRHELTDDELLVIAAAQQGSDGPNA